MGFVSIGTCFHRASRKLLVAEATFWYQEACVHGTDWWQGQKQTLIAEYGQQRVDELVKEMEQLRQQSKSGISK